MEDLPAAAESALFGGPPQQRGAGLHATVLTACSQGQAVCSALPAKAWEKRRRAPPLAEEHGHVHVQSFTFFLPGFKGFLSSK